MRTLNPKRKTENIKYKTRNPEPGNRKPDNQNAEPKTQNPEHRTQNPKSGTPDSQITEHRTPNPKPGTLKHSPPTFNRQPSTLHPLPPTRLLLPFALLVLLFLAGCTQRAAPVAQPQPPAPLHVDIDTLVCSAVQSDFNQGTINRVTAGILPGWAGLAVLAFLASTVVLIFLYVLATILRNQNLHATVKFELYEIVATLVIIVFMIGFTKGVCGLQVGELIPVSPRSELLGEQWATLSIYKSTQLQFAALSDFIRAWMEMNYLLNFHLDQMASVTPYSRPLGVGMVAAPLAGFAAPFKQLTYNAMTALSIAAVVNEAMLLVYETSMVLFLKWYLPLGIVLRSFTPMRRIGGTLIAISAGFLFIFPITTIITGIMFYDFDYGTQFTAKHEFENYWEQLRFQDITAGYLKNIASGVVNHPIDFALGGFLSVIGELLTAFTGGAFTTLFLLSISTVAQVFALGYLMPAFNVLVLVQAVRHMSRSIGEEIDITALTRLV